MTKKTTKKGGIPEISAVALESKPSADTRQFDQTVAKHRDETPPSFGPRGGETLLYTPAVTMPQASVSAAEVLPPVPIILPEAASDVASTPLTSEEGTGEIEIAAFDSELEGGAQGLILSPETKAAARRARRAELDAKRVTVRMPSLPGALGQRTLAETADEAGSAVFDAAQRDALDRAEEERKLWKAVKGVMLEMGVSPGGSRSSVVQKPSAKRRWVTWAAFIATALTGAILSVPLGSAVRFFTANARMEKIAATAAPSVPLTVNMDTLREEVKSVLDKEMIRIREDIVAVDTLHKVQGSLTRDMTSMRQDFSAVVGGKMKAMDARFVDLQASQDFLWTQIAAIPRVPSGTEVADKVFPLLANDPAFLGEIIEQMPTPAPIILPFSVFTLVQMPAAETPKAETPTVPAVVLPEAITPTAEKPQGPLDECVSQCAHETAAFIKKINPRLNEKKARTVAEDRCRKACGTLLK